MLLKDLHENVGPMVKELFQKADDLKLMIPNAEAKKQIEMHERHCLVASDGTAPACLANAR